MKIYYISIEGNTKSFLEKVKMLDKDNILDVQEVTDMTDIPEHLTPYVIFVPTYLDGGNGIDNGVTETLTNPLGEFIEDLDDGEHCLGIIGSGNRNFNQQFCLTARRYASKFNAPFIDSFELRGTDKDAERIYNELKEINNESLGSEINEKL